MLKDSLPKFIADMKELAELLNTDQIEIDRMVEHIEKMVSQFYISSATYSLNDWEREFGLEKNTTLTIAQRRARILGKLNTRTPASIKMLENLVSKTLGVENVSITEVPQEYRFIINVKSEHVLECMDIAKDAVRNARPAHLNYEFINEIARKDIKILYIGMADRKCIEQFNDIDTRRRKVLLYAGIGHRTLRITEGGVDLDEVLINR